MCHRRGCVAPGYDHRPQPLNDQRAESYWVGDANLGSWPRVGHGCLYSTFPTAKIAKARAQTPSAGSDTRKRALVQLLTRKLSPPQNHGSAVRTRNAVVKSLRKGQDDNRYLILDLDLLPQLEGVTCSPFGAVPKGEEDLSIDARVIHDLSYPKGASVNEQVQDEPTIIVTYDGAAVLARRILDVEYELPGSARMATGDEHFVMSPSQRRSRDGLLERFLNFTFLWLTYVAHLGGQILLGNTGLPVEQLFISTRPHRLCGQSSQLRQMQPSTGRLDATTTSALNQTLDRG
ncbi:LOW QUALITY PROTEIN: hypothetical protein PHMEG_00027208 [Phytophthora megakarya]|uniref:Uncharacterized protein n=1 Tax=Phytophthora megakarya TaxID=4795 RepID=A0A225V7F7_9STRA|nr:LOW QUALITY PROTEIN: hypothetical protein PHMEG_00027208 [Phytophthora megakarya]